MRKPLLATITVVAVMLLIVPLAGAITYGEPDGNRHPNVGVLVADLGGFKIPICSGTLIAPDVFLTAAHCTSFPPFEGITQVWVSFDPEFNPFMSTFYPGTFYPHPEYGHDYAHMNDLAVVVLNEPVPGIVPATLPTAGFLDELGPQALHDQAFTAVGFGVVEPDPGNGPPIYLGAGLRRFSNPNYRSLSDSLLRLSQNPANGDGGSCFGDSGGPNFFGAGDNETTMIAGVTAFGDRVCRSLCLTIRLDTPAARDFLGQFVTLP